MKRKRALVVVDMQNDFCDGTDNDYKAKIPIRGSFMILQKVCMVTDPAVFNVIVLTRDWHPENHISFKCDQQDNEHCM